MSKLKLQFDRLSLYYGSLTQPKATGGFVKPPNVPELRKCSYQEFIEAITPDRIYNRPNSNLSALLGRIPRDANVIQQIVAVMPSMSVTEFTYCYLIAKKVVREMGQLLTHKSDSGIPVRDAEEYRWKDEDIESAYENYVTGIAKHKESVGSIVGLNLTFQQYSLDTLFGFKDYEDVINYLENGYGDNNLDLQEDVKRYIKDVVEGRISNPWDFKIPEPTSEETETPED